MKFFKTSKIKQVDLDAMREEGINSIDLMERAAQRLVEALKRDVRMGRQIFLLAGPGNNGGDGLAMGRMLLQEGFSVKVFFIHEGNYSNECRINRERLLQQFPDFFFEGIDAFDYESIAWFDVVVDALFGVGLTRPLGGIYKKAVDLLNSRKAEVYSIDIPSGLQGEVCGSPDDSIVRATKTYTLQFPKLALLLPENGIFSREFEIVNIDLHPVAINGVPSNLYYTIPEELVYRLIKRSRFAHKGDAGHLLLWAGNKGMAGAALLAARAALRSGAGLLSVHSAEENRIILQTALPEAMFLSELKDMNRYDALALGPGLGRERVTEEMLVDLLRRLNKPCVLDADALNILSDNYEHFDSIPENSILTPHPKEFDRLFGSSYNSLERIDKAREIALHHQLYIIIKGANSVLVTPGGSLFFNSTGNVGMATGGMGDVLTGIIGSLLAQGYSSFDSALIGMYLHGYAADLALAKQSVESLLPSDVVENIGDAFKYIRSYTIRL